MPTAPKPTGLTAREICQRFNIPPPVLGMPDTRKLPKDARRRFDRVFFGFLEKLAGRKLYAYEKEILKAMMKGEIVLTPRRAGRATLKKLLSPPNP